MTLHTHGRHTDVVVFDTETTGLYALGRNGEAPDRICSLAAIHLHLEGDTWSTVSQRTSLFNPGRRIAPDAARVNGFFWSEDPNEPVPAGMTDLRMQPTFASKAAIVSDFMQGKLKVAHNANFDLSFLDQELHAAGLPMLDGRYACTRQSMAEAIGKGRDNKFASGTRLDDMCNYLSISRTGRLGGHGALIDTRLCAQGYMEFEALGLTFPRDINELEHRCAPVSLLHL